ncbi:hypothetical protein DLR72_15300 [Vibrio paracholerae]|uniref:Uncharacterized protein n=1 Tax=Vibrio paracholerae TaxID=650003 RepID=A0ABD7FST9_9VIBR|nr:hypothetical protein DLR72_15300 [Vibrio paracholerae]
MKSGGDESRPYLLIFIHISYKAAFRDEWIFSILLYLFEKLPFVIFFITVRLKSNVADLLS